MFIEGLARVECWEEGWHRGRLRCPRSKEQRHREPSSRGGLRSHTKGTNSTVMAEKTKEEAQLWSRRVPQEASVSKLSYLVPGRSRVKLTFLSYHRISPNSPPELQAEWKWGSRALSPQCWPAEGSRFRSQEASEVTSHLATCS